MAFQSRRGRGGGYNHNSGHHRDHGGPNLHQQTGRMSRWSDKDDKSSLEAASEAAAKVNAMLIAKGALKPSQLSQQQPTSKQKTTVVPGNMAFAEVEINDVPIGCRNMLTRGSTQEEISKISGAGVSTRGRYLNPQERGGSDRPLYLCIQSPSKESVDIAVNRINEIINNYKNKGSRFSPANPALQTRPQLIPDPRAGPPPGFIAQPPSLPPPQTVILQEKLYIGLEHAPPNFGVKEKIIGPEGTYLQHIEMETAAKVSLRGKGSGFFDSIEPMHVFLEHTNPLGLGQAKQLAENLIQTVQQDYATFQQALAALPAGHATLIAGLSQQTSMPGTLINPGLTSVHTMAPPPTLQQLPSPGGTTRIMVPSSLAPVQALPPGPIASALGISAPSVMTAQPPPMLVQTQAGPPPQLLGPPQLQPDQLVTSMPPELPVVSQATLIPGVSPWGPPHSMPAQMISRNSPPPLSTPSPLVSSPHVSTSYSYAPREEPRRRFTEEKEDDKVPENLLGYEHGPPHLANLVVQGTPNQHELPPAVSSLPLYQPHVSEMYTVAHTAGQPMPSSASLQTDERNFSPGPGGMYGDDKQLMPPPPIPASLKRTSGERMVGSDRKKGRISPSEFPGDEEEKARGKYQYNHISNAPQMYTQPEHYQDQRPPPEGDPGFQYQPSQPITDQYQYPPGQQPGTHLLPPPPAPLSVMSSIPSHPMQQPMYSISPSQSPPNIYTHQQEVLTSTGHPYPPHTITLSGPPPGPEQILPPDARPEDLQPPLEQLQPPPPSYAALPPPPISSSQYLSPPQSMPLMAPPNQPPVSYAPPIMTVQPPNYPPPGMPYYITS